MAVLLSALSHDTPERGALLKSVGLEAGAVSARHCASLAKACLQLVDEDHASKLFVRPWHKMPFPSRDEAPRTAGLNTRRLSDVVPRPVKWQREGFTALGKPTLLSGPPGVGKTWLMMDHIARLTTGRPYPGVANPTADRRDALFISSEDADDDTLRPRIDLLKGDPSRVHTLQFVFDGKGERSLALDRHIDELDSWLSAYPMVELVVFDPISAVLGRVDSHRDADVRSLLGPLAKVAERRQVAIVAINHLNKSVEGQAIYRSMGSIGFVAAVRIAWQVCADEENPGRSLLLPVKMNLGPRPNGLAFRISAEGISWDEEPVIVTADEALNGPSAGKRDEAKDFLRNLLKDGPVPATSIFDQAKALRLGKSTVKAAKRELRVEATHVGGKGGEWQWSLPTLQQPLNSLTPLTPQEAKEVEEVKRLKESLPETIRLNGRDRFAVGD